jgi:hypothetical protein
MKIENLRSLIRESINEYINKIDEEGNAAMYTAKKQACEAAIEARQQKLTRIDESDDLKELVAPDKIKEIQREIADLQKYKVKVERLEEKARNKGKKKVTTDAETDDKEAAVDENDILDEMDLSDEESEELRKKAEKNDKEYNPVNESFLKIQKLACVITEAEYNKKKRLVENYTPPAYEAINDLMDMINMNTGTKGRIVPYRSISWLPSVSDADGDMDMLVYKKGEYEIAIGADDVYQSTDDPDSNVWIIDSNDPNAYFEEHMTFDEAENAASEWLKS